MFFQDKFLKISSVPQKKVSHTCLEEFKFLGELLSLYTIDGFGGHEDKKYPMCTI